MNTLLISLVVGVSGVVIGLLVGVSIAQWAMSRSNNREGML